MYRIAVSGLLVALFCSGCGSQPEAKKAKPKPKQSTVAKAEPQTKRPSATTQRRPNEESGSDSVFKPAQPLDAALEGKFDPNAVVPESRPSSNRPPRTVDPSPPDSTLAEPTVEERMQTLQFMGLAMLNYVNTHKKLAPSSSLKPEHWDAEGKPLLSWRVYILPFGEGGGLFDQFQLTEPWNSENNRKWTKERAPGLSLADDPTLTRILAFYGHGALYGDDMKGEGLEQITDGLEETIMFVEVARDRAVPWAEPVDLAFDPENPRAALGKIEGDYFLAVFCSGRVRKIRADIPNDKLAALITKAGGEKVDPAEWEMK
jgi:hypothetical protein